MGRVKKLIVMLLLGATLFQASCIGPFRLTSKLHEWNSNIGDKFINELVFLAFVIIPVYEIAILADGIVFNSIEFWGGGNPVSMKEGEEDTKIVSRDGVKYRVTAKKNMFEVEQLEGPEKGEIVHFLFEPNEKAWYLETPQLEAMKVVEHVETGIPSMDQVRIFKPDREYVQVRQDASQEEVRVLLKAP